VQIKVSYISVVHTTVDQCLNRRLTKPSYQKECWVFVFSLSKENVVGRDFKYDEREIEREREYNTICSKSIQGACIEAETMGPCLTLEAERLSDS